MHRAQASPIAQHLPDTVLEVSERLLRGLTDAQRLAVATDHAPLCVLAGAGSGKTTVLTRRVARRVLDGSADARRTLVVTFTRKAASELRSRIARLGVEENVWAGTLHAAAYRQLRRYWADHEMRAPAVLDAPARLVGKVLTELSTAGAPADPGLVAAVAGEVHWARVRLVDPDEYPHFARGAARALPLSPTTLAEVYRRYGEQKRKRGVVDLDDLVYECARLVESDPDFAAAQRWQFRHIFVDEFQDLNPAQWRLVKAWIGDRLDLFVVGDPRQAVYGWNGSDPTLIARLPEMIPGTAVISLGENHRSSPQIVSAALAVFGTDPEDLAHATGGVGGATPAGAGTASTDEPFERPADGPPPTIKAFDDDHAEASSVTRWLRVSHRPGTTWSSIAVLARTNARLDPIAAALQTAGIPYRSTCSGGPAHDPRRQVLRDALCALRAMPGELPLRSALAHIVAGPAVGPSDGDEPADPQDATGEELVDSVVPLELARLADEFADEEPAATVGGFMAWIAATDALSDTEARQHVKDEKVELATFHKAKGLEWRAVAVVGLEDGMVPIAYATSSEELEEERRLLYVALTRAREELWCSWAATRHDEGRAWSCERSPFLEAVEAAVLSGSPTDDLDMRRARISELRDRLAATG